MGLLARVHLFDGGLRTLWRAALLGVTCCVARPAWGDSTSADGKSTAASSAVSKTTPGSAQAVAPAPSPAPSTPPVAPLPGTEQARLVYEQAVQAYGERRYKDAILLFQQADALRPNPAFSFNIGLAYEEMGDSAMALLFYRSYLRQLPKASDRDEVDVRIRRLERLLADKGLQQVTILSNPSGAVVKLDGTARGVTPWTGELPPGSHAVSVALAGYAEEERDFDLPPARAIDVPVTLHRPRPQPSRGDVVRSMNSTSPGEELALWQHVRPLTWGVFGVGAAALGGALGFELARVDVEERSRASEDPAQRADLHERATRREVWAKGLLMLGLGLGVTAIALGYQDIDDGLSRQAIGVSLDWTPGRGPRVGLTAAF